MTFPQPNPPIGLGYLAAVLEKNGFNAIILDLAIRNISQKTLIKFIKKKKPLLIGISALTVYYEKMKEMSSFLKKEVKNIPIVLGGVHATALPRITIKECNADFLVVGEGEETIVELASKIKEGAKDFSGVKGIVYRAGDEIITTPARPLIKNLDELPFPAWHKINPNNYPPEPHGVVMKHEKVAPIMSTRGCPYKCSYCASCMFWRRRIRFRSPKSVVDEIEYLHDKFGIKEIHFWDDNITLKRSHIVGICKEILKRDLKMSFATPNGLRVDTLDEKLLSLMKTAGFYALTFSIESASKDLLKNAFKNVSLKKVVNLTRTAKKLGFFLKSFNIIGFPGETRETIMKTFRFNHSLDFEICNFFIMKPLPGSFIFEQWSKNIDLLNYNWNPINYYSPEITICDLDGKYLLKMQKKLMQKYYLHIKRLPRILFLRLVKYGHVYQLKHILLNRIRYF
ncbi:MAG: B12-binding domain-containing radical SAM protein, partial [Promethearchaeota archaeon]